MKRDNGEIKKIRIALPRMGLIHAPFIPFVPIMKIVGETGIEEMLKKALSKTESK